MSIKKKTVIESSLVEQDRESLAISTIKDETPQCKAVGMVKTSKGWLSYVVHFQGDEVLNVVFEEPQPKYSAYDSAKISFINEFDKDEV